MKYTNRLKLFIALLLVFVMSLSVAVDAEVFLYTPNEPGRTGSIFYFEASPGDELSDSIDIYNSGNQSVNLNLFATDSVHTREGGIIARRPQQEQRRVGSWISMESSELSIPKDGRASVGFSATIPEDIAEGEYLGYIIASEDGSTDSNSLYPVSVNFTKTIKVYFKIGNDLRINADIQNIDILGPNDDDASTLRSRLPYWGRENIVSRYTIRNTSNIFSRLEGTFRVIQNGVETKSDDVAFDLYPLTGDKDYFIITNQAYEVGENILEFDYKLVPVNIDTSEIRYDESIKTVQNTLNINEDDFAEIEPAAIPAIQNESQRLEVINSDYNPDEDSEVVEEGGNLMNIFYIVLISILVLLIAGLGVVIFIKYKRPEIWKKLTDRFSKPKGGKTNKYSKKEK